MNNNNIFITPEDIALHISALTNPKKVSDAMAFGGRPEQEVRTKYLKAANWVLEYAAQQVAAALAANNSGIPKGSEGEEMTEFEQESLEKVANNYHSQNMGLQKDRYEMKLFEAFKDGAKWAVKFRTSWQGPAKAFASLYEKEQQQTASLREQLEKMRSERNQAFNDFSGLQFSNVQAERRHLKQLAEKDAELNKLRFELDNANAAQEAYYEIADMFDVPEGGSVIERAEKVIRLLGEKDARIKELEEVVKDLSRVMRDEYWQCNTDESGFPTEPLHDDLTRSRIKYCFEKNSIPLVV